MSNSSKPAVVVLGGCGFIGRNLVEYLITNDLASAVRVVDKTPPQLAFLNPRHSAVFDDPRVQYKSANLINPASCAAALAPAEDGRPWDVAVNCAAETRPGQAEPVYREGILTLSANVAAACRDLHVRLLVEISSGFMYNSDQAATEETPPSPWTLEARLKLAAEQALARVAGLRYCVLRPAIVYGVADRRSLTPRLLLGGVYKHLNETMKLLWSKSLRLNTVHVRDLCAAVWLVASLPPDAVHGQVYHVVDEADTTQGDLAEIVCEIFGIQHDYYGTAISTLAKTDMAGVAEEANEKHGAAWAAALRAHGVAHSPLEPGAAADLLQPRALRLCGAKLARAGHAPAHPAPSAAALREVLEDYASMNLFPKALLL